jgi:hypothetical protein
MSDTDLRFPSTTISSGVALGSGGHRALAPQSFARRAAMLLSALVAILMLVVSAAGLVVEGLYRDPEPVSSMLRGDDLVTLVLVVPTLTVALAGVRRRSALAELVWVGVLAGAVYTYAFYVLGTAFNALFLLHVAVLSGAVFALALALASMDVHAITKRLRARTPRRVIATILAMLTLGLAGMWIYVSLRFAATGEVPLGSALVETEAIVHLGIALDLTLLVPVYAAAVVLLWRRAPWGYVLAAVALVSGVVHQVGYLVAMPFQVAAGVPGAVATDPAEPVIVALYLVATALLLVPLARKGSGPEDNGKRWSR